MHIKIDGHAEWDSRDVIVKQDATPVDASESFGSTGSFSFAIPERVDAKALTGAVVELVDGEFTLLGVIVAVSGNGRTAVATASTILNPLVAKRNAAPHLGTIATYLTYLFGLVGMPAPAVDTEIADAPVVTIGWADDVWRMVKAFCVAQRVEVLGVDAEIVVRPFRRERASRAEEADYRWSTDASRLAKRVEAWYYEKTPVTDALLRGNRDPIVANLGAGETVEIRVPLEVSLSSVDQPVCLDSVPYAASSASMYAVRDRWGKPVAASYWRDHGGDVAVAIGADSRSMTITITGCLDLNRAPYQLAGTRKKDGEDLDYPTLRIVGSGVAFTRKKHSIPACVDGSATEEVGCEFDSVFVDSWAHAHYLLLWAAVKYGSPTVRITGAAKLGAAAGARLRDDYAEFRVRTLTRGASGKASYDAEFDTTMGDVADVWAGRTLGEFEDAHTTAAAFNAHPLKT
ncbi:hypothetical protein [Agromyces sp. NPDC058064]|uniref:hypothetical protein n=1 Tax=Agromyces sp. NPDC058064 TaxID=3346322 RepID=UPI0036DAE407